jgi:uncharacterized protein YjiS (DUF1127 family)
MDAPKTVDFSESLITENIKSSIVTVIIEAVRMAMHSLAGALRLFAAMLERQRSRQILGGLTEYELKDIGMSKSQARYEASRMFWQ